MVNIFRKGIVKSFIWTLLTCVFAFGAERVAKYVFSLLHFAIRDSKLLNEIIATPVDYFNDEKLYHYSVLILSALTVEYMIYLFSSGSDKLAGGRNVLSFGIILFVLCCIFFFQSSHEIHLRECSITNSPLNCNCHTISISCLVASLIISFVIRTQTYNSEYKPIRIT